jgi:hypothetical protein
MVRASLSWPVTRERFLREIVAEVVLRTADRDEGVHDGERDLAAQVLEHVFAGMEERRFNEISWNVVKCCFL